MEIHNPRRILALGAPDSGVLNLLKDLTGSAPDVVSDSTAGLSHTWPISTRYYKTELPIWIDEIPSISEWRSEFTNDEAREVVAVLGAWIFCFRKPVTEAHVEAIKEALQAIAEVIEKACGYSADAVCLAVAMPQTQVPYLDMGNEEWDEISMEYGFEFVDATAKGKNEFGEEQGVKRVEEALKAHNWEGGEVGLDFGKGGDEDDGFNDSFDAEELEMGVELFGMKDALHGARDEDGEHGEDDEGQVEELESMMRKMMAIKEMGESMPEAQRKQFAAKAVNDLLKDL